MTTEASLGRLQVISGHLQAHNATSNRPGSLELEDCAATQRVNFARSSDLTAFGVAVEDKVLQSTDRQALRFAAAALGEAPQPCSVSVPTALVSGQPRFAKAAAKEVATASWDLPLPPQRGRACLVKASAKQFPTTVVEAIDSEHGYEVDFALPGFRAEDLTVTLKGGQLIVSGARASGPGRPRLPGTEWHPVRHGSRVYQTRLLGKGLVLRRQLGHEPFSAVWTLPEDSDLNSLDARLANGLLRVSIHKLA